MDSVASRIVKARQYAQERDRRVRVHKFEVELQGEHANHTEPIPPSAKCASGTYGPNGLTSLVGICSSN